jgi:vancomycin resistance protein YoaR
MGAYDVVLARYETEYRGAQGGRRHNIEKAARMIDGLVIEVGQRFSYNDALGPRTLDRGFRPAKELGGGELIDGVGGGICQTAGTLHAAAFLAGLAIDEHHHHSRESRYIDAGLDAMVSWPAHDLVLRNDLPFPIRISAKTSGGAVTVELLGREQLRQVQWRTRVVGLIPPREERVHTPELYPGSEELQREGRHGMELERTRFVRGDRTRVEEERLVYPPLNRRVRVGGS